MIVAGGLAAPGPGSLALPCAGAVGAQPAALMDAFALLDAWAGADEAG